MAKLALLTFALVILNSTVRINADVQLITVLYKLIESVEQLNSSISKINGRLDKLDDTILTRPDPEPMHGRVDEKAKKALESEKVLIRKSLSVYENKFQVFEAQVNRHLSSMYTAIESNKDKVDEQIRLMNESLDRKSDALHVQQEIQRINATFDRTKDNVDKQIRLINESLDRKSDAFHVQQEIQRINATFDRTKDNVDKQIRLMNESLDRKSDALHVQQEIRHTNATFNRTKDNVDEQIRLMNETLDRKSDALHVHQEIRRINATFEQLYNTQRCSYSHESFQLYSGNTKLNIVEHNSMVEVKCKNGDNYELKNTETNQYIDSFNTKCLFGHLHKDLSVLKCLPKRCSHGSLQLNSRNKQLNNTEHNSTVAVKCKDVDNYELKNTKTDRFIDSFNTKCLFGHLDNTGVLKCLPKRCFNENSKIALYTGDRSTRVVTHTSKVDVKCIDDGYELKNTKTVKYESNLTTTCTFGKFDYQISQLACLIRRPYITYSVRLKVSESRGQGEKVNVRVVGNGQTAEFQLKGVWVDDWSLNKLDDLYFTETDVRPIQSVVVRKDRDIRRDDDLSMEYVSIYIEESDEYYVFTNTSLHTNLKDSQPLTLTLSDHPEKCSSHTYGEALERHPRDLRRRPFVGWTTLYGCKIRCITTQSIKCKSVFFMPITRTGRCYFSEHSPDDDIYFRDNYSWGKGGGYRSYERICNNVN